MNRRDVTAALGRANWQNFGAPNAPTCSWGGGELPTWVCPDQNPGGCNSQTPGCNPNPNLAGLGTFTAAPARSGFTSPRVPAWGVRRASNPVYATSDRSKFAASCRGAGLSYVEGNAGGGATVGACCNAQGVCGASHSFDRGGRSLGGAGAVSGLGACASQQRNMIANPGAMGCQGPCVSGRCKCWKAGGCACKKGG